MKKVVSVALALVMSAMAFCYDFTLKITPSAMFPFLTGGEKKYDFIGGGGFIDPGVTFFDLLNAGPELGFFILPKYNSKGLEGGSEPNVTVVPFGAQAGVFFYPFSRIDRPWPQ